MEHRGSIVVVGGGHAGCEAAHVAARLGVPTILVTHRADRIGEMSCNPAIGGLGKGHLVREIDALDGLMGRIADRAGIQFRLLNRRKGPAVRGPRAQCDRALYRRAMQEELAATPTLRIVEGEVVELIEDGTIIRGVRLADGSEIKAIATILTTGTFLRGIIHMGETSRAGGRIGDAAATRLAEQIDGFGLPLGRLKTGTPPRLARGSIDWDALETQPGDDAPELFSFLSTAPQAHQVPCHITHTNAATHEIIRGNLSRSAMYGERIEGTGPRYCPSIEDKVVRFADKDSHQVFLEPEGLDSDWIYPNGISTSLPVDVQEAYIRSIKGLQQAEILQPGYAIEYDYVDPRALDATLALNGHSGLWFAGQINGTTGYEEAAGQGLVAGLNAALAVLECPAQVFDRADAYLGVMIDDLVTRGVTEPYRMFTSRAEFRLRLRADNADRRLTPIGLALGCVGERRRQAFGRAMDEMDAATSLASSLTLSPPEARGHGLTVNQDGVRRSALDLLAYRDVDLARLVQIWPELAAIPERARMQIENDAQYAGYLPRQEAEIARLRADERLSLPSGIDYAAIQGLSSELQEKLAAARPQTMAQALRIDGMTPAAAALVALAVRRSA